MDADRASESILVMGLPSRLVSWGLKSRQHVHYGQQRRSLLLVCGAGAAQVSDGS